MFFGEGQPGISKRRDKRSELRNVRGTALAFGTLFAPGVFGVFGFISVVSFAWYWTVVLYFLSSGRQWDFRNAGRDFSRSEIVLVFTGLGVGKFLCV